MIPDTEKDSGIEIKMGIFRNDISVDIVSDDNYNRMRAGGNEVAKTGRPITGNAKNKKVTIRLSDELHEKLVAYAAEHNQTMTDVALKALEEKITEKA